MKIRLTIILVVIVVMGIFLLFIPRISAQGELWKYVSSLLQPVVSTWNVYVPANFRFDGEIQPDGSTCSNGQILKKTGTNDWDCANEAGGSGGSNWNFLTVNAIRPTTTVGI